jgi:hypothetical protein
MTFKNMKLKTPLIDEFENIFVKVFKDFELFLGWLLGLAEINSTRECLAYNHYRKYCIHIG